MEFYEKQLDEIYKQFGSDAQKGLSNAAVEELRNIHGLNELTREEKEAWYVLLGRQFTGILIYILVAAALVSGFLGEWVDTIAIITILVINGVLGFIQEAKAQASIESLKRMASAKATVIRNGKTMQLPAEQLVPGDILVLQTGDKIPADARVIEAIQLDTQEGALTGESTPVTKNTSVLTGKLPLGDQKNMLFSGTIITKGRGRAIVIATGMKTEIGKIAHLIQETDVEDTPLQKELDTMGGKIGKITLGICAAIFVIIILAMRSEMTIEGLKDPFLLAISLAVAAIPEGLPIVVTIALAFGTQRMIKKNALIKRLASVETLGETTVICTDKTGTLTKNEMTVVHVWHGGNIVHITGTGYAPAGEIQGSVPRVLHEISILCNDSDIMEEQGAWSITGDPTEGCLLTLARKAGFNEDDFRKTHPRVNEAPFSSERKRMTTVNRFDTALLALTKGAPDIILEHCNRILDEQGVREMTQEDRTAILAANEQFASNALRVLGFAFTHAPDEHTNPETLEHDMIFVALTGMIDPPREEAKAAIARCSTAGIRVIMITGDHKTTAVAIAEQLGIVGDAIEGKDIANIDLDARVEDIAVYARVDPEHKMTIVDALRKKGHVVAMTGDGVNDAPALKRADIGVSMGITGTEVAKESASMILTDDNFSSIVNAVEEGRNIYTNIKKFVNYLLSSNFAEVLVILLAILLFRHDGNIVWPLTATMILFMNLVTDSLPALALGVDPGDKKVMQKPPRDPKAHIISLNMIVNIVLIGVLVAGATLLAFKWSLDTTGNLAHAQTMALTTLVVLELVRLAMIRSQYNTPRFSNPWLYLSLGIVFVLQFAVIYTPVGHLVFDTVSLAIPDWIVVIAISAGTYLLGMLIGAFAKKMTGQHD